MRSRCAVLLEHVQKIMVHTCAHVMIVMLGLSAMLAMPISPTMMLAVRRVRTTPHQQLYCNRCRFYLFIYSIVDLGAF